MPWIQEALESMAGVTHFSMMDFKSGIWQVKTAPDPQQYTAFTVGNLGFYKFTHMLFGLCNAPATFNHLMQNTLGELILTYCIIYLNNVIMFGHTEEEHLQCPCIVFEWFCKFNLKLKQSKCSFFQLEIVYLVHHISCDWIHSSQDNVSAVEEFPMPKSYTQVHTFCRLMGHYRPFIKGFAHIVQPLYDVLWKEVKMGPVQLPPKVWMAVRILKDKIQTTPVLVFPDFDKPSCSGWMLPRKGWAQYYHWSRMMGTITPLLLGATHAYHLRRTITVPLEFLALKCSVTEHFKEYLMYALFVVSTDNNLLTYVLTMPNLDATRQRWVCMLASFEFTLEYQKGADNEAADALSCVPICYNHETMRSLFEGVIVGATDRKEAAASEELLCEHEHLGNEAQVQAARMAPMHIVDLGEAQEADPMLTTCRGWLHNHKDTSFPKRDVLLKTYLGDNADTEEGHVLFHMHKSLVMSKGLLYVSTMPKGEAEGILAFLVPTGQCHAALNGVHHEVGHQGQQRMLPLMQERFWWPMMVHCWTLVWGCQWCCIFEGAKPKAPVPDQSTHATGACPHRFHKCGINHGAQ